MNTNLVQNRAFYEVKQHFIQRLQIVLKLISKDDRKVKLRPFKEDKISVSQTKGSDPNVGRKRLCL